MKRLTASRYFLRASSVLALLLIAATLVARARAAQFIPLPEGNIAWDVSGDGSTVVGNANSGAFRWRAAAGFEIINGMVTADGVSSDGSVIAGSARTSQLVPAIWSQSNGIQPIGVLPNSFSTVVRGISGDGRVVVGYTLPTSGPPKAFRWDAQSGAESISVVLSGGTDAANAVSENGEIIVGDDGQTAFKWTRATGLVDLGRVGFAPDTAAWGVSADGNVVVGGSGTQAFRWTPTTGMKSLGDLPGGASNSFAWDITPDGSKIVGYGSTDRGLEAFIWTQQAGMQSLMSFAEQNGANLAGWQLQVAEGISDDGTVIVGAGLTPDGRSAAWVLIIPEPSGFLMLGIAMLFFARTRMRRGAGAT